MSLNDYHDDESYSLKDSTKLLGQLVPIILDKHGNTVDGFHRVKEDLSWSGFSVKAVGVDTPMKLALAQLIVNTNRRRVSSEEKTRLLGKIYEDHKKEYGYYPSVELVATWLGRTAKWVWAYLPKEFKDPGKVKAGEKTPHPIKQEREKVLTDGEQKQPEVDLRVNEPSPPNSNPPTTTTADEPEIIFGYRGTPEKEPYSKGLSPTASQHSQKADTPAENKLQRLLSSMRGIPCDFSFMVPREGEFNRDGSPKFYAIDALVDGWLGLEAEGDGSASTDNDKRDAFLATKGIQVIHIPNDCIAKHPEVLTQFVYLLHSRNNNITKEVPTK